jgi:hypothetical protein
MTRRRLLSTSSRDALFEIPSDTASLERFYVLAEDDLDLIRSRRTPQNCLGLAVRLALLRHPGRDWSPGEHLPATVVDWISDQLQISPAILADYGDRKATRTQHRNLAHQHLGLRPFMHSDVKPALELATQAAFGTDDGRVIMERLLQNIKGARLVLPSVDTLERIGISGRARARRQAAQSLNDALSEDQREALKALLVNNPDLGLSQLAWLRGMPHSTSTASLHALLERLKFVRALGLPPDLGHDIHPARLLKFALEGAVAPAHLLSDFGERRRLATLAAQMSEINIVLTDASIALFERLTGQLFTRSRRKQDQTWQASQSKVGRLMRLFGSTLEALQHAHKNESDPFEVLDGTVGWERLMKVKPEVDALGDMATEDPLTLASRRYVQLRKFAPAFLEAFSFSVPEAGADLQDALELLREHNKSGKRKLPDDEPDRVYRRRFSSYSAARVTVFRLS